MPNKDYKVPLKASRRLITLGVGASMLLVVLVTVMLVTRQDNIGLTDSTRLPSSEITTTSTELDGRTVVVERLKHILRIRDQAFRDRNSVILADVYTVDCPCLEGDTNAIEELVTNNYHIVGGATSIRVRRAEQVSKRLWLVVADFRSAPLRIEAKDKELIREEPAGDELFQFALSKPTGSTDWLLGRATAYRNDSG
jgi:hypothetical protein